ncbi:MAG TPA: carboxylating nicotinate-nucleotide diphosphorylase [Thermoguttaceae bacterium]|nr:carboxylating nicotinate-nucleotide diphosphorylase [Thermoguttaceae bacterium]
MNKQFRQQEWGEQLEADWRALLRLAADEDLGGMGDLTTRALVGDHVMAAAAVVARKPGILAGAPAALVTLEFFDLRLQWTAEVEDGQAVAAGQVVARIEGPAAGLLTAERPLLNVLGRLSGIATLTSRYVDAVCGTKAEIFDTRKTTPGWRRLEKYAVRCGGGRNHRSGLNEAILIKDNHLAFAGGPSWESTNEAQGVSCSPAEAVRRARRFVKVHVPQPLRAGLIVEVEVDTLTQLESVLTERPDLVLLDNMMPEELRRAVALRDATAGEVELEASGGVDLETVRSIASTGVERISVGALTHSAVWLDFGLDRVG